MLRIRAVCCAGYEVLKPEKNLFLDDGIETGTYSIKRMMDVRPTKEEGYMLVAKAVAQRSTCLRRKYGCVIIKDDIPVSFGYNGAPRGEPNCCDVGYCWREENHIPHGERYEACRACHAEDNAISFASAHDLLDATLYLYGEENGQTIEAKPCDMCARRIKNVRIKEVISSKPSADDR